MCGIFGVVTAGAPLRRVALEAASASLVHRGPDGFGYLLANAEGARVFHDRECPREGNFNVALATRRLAIIDLISGQQPVGNEDGSVWCVFNGEIYNYRSLRAELIERGHRFQTAGDTEVLCHGYEEWGADIVQRLQGMFGFAIYDGRAKTVSLFRDRAGIKPLYYSLDAGRFLFGSEIKSILAYDRDIRVCRENVFEFFLFDQIPPPGTAYDSIFKLDSGELLVLDCATLKVRRRSKYWDFRFDIKPWTASSAVAEVEAVLDRVVRKQLVADVPVGTFLSGGLDSSLVTRSVARHSPTKAIHLYTQDAWSEYRWANHPAFDPLERVNILCRPSLGDCLAALRGVDDLFRDASILPTYLVSRAARENGLKVVLSGDGADETLAGYDQIFYPAYLYERCRAFGLRGRLRGGLLLRLCARALWPQRYAAALLELLRAQSYLPHFADVENLNWLTVRKRQPGSVMDFRAERLGEFAGSGEEPADLNRLLYSYCRFFMNVVLEKVDFASMANSVEVRVPFLDEEMLSLTLQIPFAIKIKARGKFPLKAIASRVFGPDFAHRPKSGFSLDFSSLFARPEIAAYFRDAVRRPGLDEFLDVPSIKRLVERDRRGKMDGKRLWRALMFAEWFENWGRRHA